MKSKKNIKLPIQLNLDLTTINNKQSINYISTYHYKLLVNAKLEEIPCSKKTTEKFNCNLKIREDSIKILDIYLTKIKEAISEESIMNDNLNKLKQIFPNFKNIELKNGLKFFVGKYIFIEINENNFIDDSTENFDLLQHFKTNNLRYSVLIEFLKTISSRMFHDLQFSINLFWKCYFISKLDIENCNEYCPLMFIITKYELMLCLGDPFIDATGNLILRIEILGNIFLELKFEIADKYKPKLKLFDNLAFETPSRIREIIDEYLFKEGIYDFLNYLDPQEIKVDQTKAENYMIVNKGDLILCLHKIRKEYHFISNKHAF